MGSSADAHVVYGFGWGGDEGPPIWSGKYGYDPTLIDRPALADHLKYADEDTDDAGSWLGAVVKMHDPNELLDTHYVGNIDYSGDAVFIRRTKIWAWQYAPMAFTLENPTAEELAVLTQVAKYLGYTTSDIGWKVFPSYG